MDRRVVDRALFLPDLDMSASSSAFPTARRWAIGAPAFAGLCGRSRTPFAGLLVAGMPGAAGDRRRSRAATQRLLETCHRAGGLGIALLWPFSTDVLRARRPIPGGADRPEAFSAVRTPADGVRSAVVLPVCLWPPARGPEAHARWGNLWSCVAVLAIDVALAAGAHRPIWWAGSRWRGRDPAAGSGAAASVPPLGSRAGVETLVTAGLPGIRHPISCSGHRVHCRRAAGDRIWPLLIVARPGADAHRAGLRRKSACRGAVGMSIGAIALTWSLRRFHHPGRDDVEAVGEARFIHLWQNKDGAWIITRIISYDHHSLGK